MEKKFEKATERVVGLFQQIWNTRNSRCQEETMREPMADRYVEYYTTYAEYVNENGFEIIEIVFKDSYSEIVIKYDYEDRTCSYREVITDTFEV